MRIEEAREKIEKAGGDWEVFLKWMEGQTMSLYPDGTTNIYTYDVNRFIGYDCNPDNEPLGAWD